MNKLKIKLAERQQVINKKNTYTNNFALNDIKRKKINRVIIIGSVVAILGGIIYIPQFFIKDKISNPYLLEMDKSIINKYDELVNNSPDLDFDNDGLSNIEEMNNTSDIWKKDSDGDGILDKDELDVTNTDIISFNKTLEDFTLNKLKSENKSIKTPYKMNGVVLWADNTNSRVYGSVIKTLRGYYFNEFSGYAQFLDYQYAYKIIDGKHILLNHKKTENVWKIDGNYEVYVTNDKLDMLNKVSIFGNSTYIKSSAIGNFISDILPNKGILTSETIAKIDLDPDTNIGTKINIVCPNINESDYSRLCKNTNSIDDLVKTRTYIDNNITVACSLFSEKAGEAIGIVYGYTNTGDLILADYKTMKPVGILKIVPVAQNIMNFNGIDGTISENDIFEFYGLGFDSSKGDRINFFETSSIATS